MPRQNATLQTTSTEIRTRAWNHQGCRPKIQSASSDRSGGTEERRAAAIPFIDAILENDFKAPFNQRHTAHQIWEQLQVEMPGCDVGESTVRTYVRVRKAELDGAEQTSSQTALAWMMKVLHIRCTAIYVGEGAVLKKRAMNPIHHGKQGQPMAHG